MSASMSSCSVRYIGSMIGWLKGSLSLSLMNPFDFGLDKVTSMFAVELPELFRNEIPLNSSEVI